jgi:hypothetical protein
MNNGRNLIYYSILIATIFTLYITIIESFTSTIAKVDPSQKQIKPIPPLNITNNQTIHIGFLQYSSDIKSNKDMFTDHSLLHYGSIITTVL